MSLKTWLFEFMHEIKDPAKQHDRAAITAHFDFYTDLWTRAEARGFDGIFFSEHHFGGAYSPSPNLLISNVAARTSTLRLGVLGMVGPYCTPWRVVEEFAMLSHLTHGRMEMGVVSGIPPEFITAGLSIPEMGARHNEICEVLNAARNGEAVTHHGTHWSFDNLRFLPPFRDPNPPMWTAVRSAESAAKAARRGWKIAVGFNSVANVAAICDVYRTESAAAGFTVGPDDIGVRRLVTFTESDSVNDRRDGVLRGKQSLLRLLESSAGPLPPFAGILDRPDEESEMLSNDEFVSGSPDGVADQLIAQASAVGAGHVMVMFSDMDPTGLDRSHGLYAEHVIPKLHQ